MYIPEYFKLQELLPKDFYLGNERFIEKYPHRFWGFFDERILWTIDNLRKLYGTAIANDWMWRDDKNANQFRGWRPGDCKIGAKFSQHKFGRAVDLIFPQHKSSRIRKDIVEYKDDVDIFKHIAFIEFGVHWLHIDVRNGKSTLGASK